MVGIKLMLNLQPYIHFIPLIKPLSLIWCVKGH